MSAALLLDALAVDKFLRREAKQPETKTHSPETLSLPAIANVCRENHPYPFDGDL
jgi:hypothetical protein